jgi:hypothetical protein
MVVTQAARNANEAVVGSGRVSIWSESGVRLTVLSVGAFGRNMT